MYILHITCFQTFFSVPGSHSSKASLRSPPKAGPKKTRSRPDGSMEYPSWVSGLGKEYPSWVEDLDTTGWHRKKERSVFKQANLGHSPVIYMYVKLSPSLHLVICMSRQHNNQAGGKK